MRVHALYIGTITTQIYDGREVRTAGHKRAVAKAQLTRLGLIGDEQADRRYHGGPDRSLCVYPLEHYLIWARDLGRALPPGGFSENLTITGLAEDDVSVGDILGIGPPGEARVEVQVSLPRGPCSRVAAKLQIPDLVARIKDSGRSGYYLRTLRDGEIRAGDEVVVLQRDPAGVSITEANQVMYRQRRDRASLLRVLAVEALGAQWRRRLESRL
jgi:MOSC domain-containing protein YiiM